MKSHSQDWVQARSLAETVPCPACKAPKGETCTGIDMEKK